MNKPIVIYHGNCADGFSSAWVFFQKFGNNVDYHAGVYGVDPPDCTNRDVYLVDFSYTLDVVEMLLGEAKSITLIDHHKTAIERLLPLMRDGKINHHVSMERSGAMLAWEFCFPNKKAPELLKYVEDRDLWRFDLYKSREVSAALFSYPYDFETWTGLMYAPSLEKMMIAGEAIERKHHKDIGELLDVCTVSKRIGGYDVLVANMPYTLSSDGASKLGEGMPFGACYFDKAEGRVYSLRSTETGIDVAKIAEIYGGGGHMHASGFTIKWDDKESGLI